MCWKYADWRDEESVPVGIDGSNVLKSCRFYDKIGGEVVKMSKGS